MTSAPPHVAVVATSLARTDRRALSQAWYSALHLAEHAPPRTDRPHAEGTPPSHGTEVRPASLRGSDAAPSGAGGARALPRSSGAVLPVLDRRAPATPLAKRIERAIAHAPAQTPAASVAIKAGGGRVQVLVRSDGEATRIVALCAPALRERVEQALAHARFALAAQGVRVVA